MFNLFDSELPEPAIPRDAPLAARMRPRTLEEFVGQEEILGAGKPLRRAIEADELSSLILWVRREAGKPRWPICWPGIRARISSRSAR